MQSWWSSTSTHRPLQVRVSISEQTDFWPPRPNEDDGDEENEVDEEGKKNRAEEEQDVQTDEESEQGLWKRE